MSSEMDRLSEMMAWQIFLEENPNYRTMENTALVRSPPAVGTSRGARTDGPAIPAWARQLGEDEDWIRLQQAALENFASHRDKKGKGTDHNPGRAGQSGYNPRPVDPPRQNHGRVGPPRHNPPAAVGKGKGRATGVNCTACMEEIGSEVHRLPCNDAYCTDCLLQLIQTAMKGETGSFPPVCCKQPITVDSAKSVLSAADFKTYQERLEDRKPEVQIFCCNPRCSKRLEPKDIKGETGSCPTCRTKTCTKCKQPDHRGICAENNELVELAKKENWKGCPKCRRLIEKQPGTCNQVLCVCGIAFCYLCGKQMAYKYARAEEGGCSCPLLTAKDVVERVRLGIVDEDEDDAGDDFGMLNGRRIVPPRMPEWVQWAPPPLPPPPRFPEPQFPGFDPRFFHNGRQFGGFREPIRVAPPHPRLPFEFMPPPPPPPPRRPEFFFDDELDAEPEEWEYPPHGFGFGWR
jgi:hypothetical protein